ncbi:MAG: hypothetical protein JNM55_19325 [Anaerolineales bacterium]|nr:hypothetical protein [Anaerolineales bacterium]
MKCSEKLLITLVFLGLFLGSCFDFLDIAWGTGNWLGEFASTWAIIFVAFCFFAFILFITCICIIWRDSFFKFFVNTLIALRSRLKFWRWFLAVAIFVFPVYFFQFTVLGVVFQGLYIRLTLWVLELFLISFFLTKKEDVFIDQKVLLFMLVMTASSFSVASTLSHVTSYPFSLGWSEGNRLWDYSIIFGRERYDFPQDQEIFVFLDIGRQLVGGIPFLFPDLTIRAERMWVGLTLILPYIFLGLASFRSFIREKYTWFAMILWTFLFLKQGPIHPPLILCALLIMLAWRNKLWLSIPLVALATYAAYVSRYTWTFAPGMWFIMLELIDGSSGNGNTLSFKPRIRFLASLMGLCILCGFSIFWIGSYFKIDKGLGIFSYFFILKISPEYILGKIQQQPLLWYRLFPNETYGSGILMGLLFALCPLIFVLFQLVKSKIWVLNSFQKWVIFLPVLAFFIVGIVVSVKIGGGGDLHNMDMFLISLFMLTVIALHNMTDEWMQFRSLPVTLGVILLLVIPGIDPLMEMRSYSYYGSVSWLAALTDAPTERSLGMYPPKEVINKSLDTIQAEVDTAKISGEILFMDQRQLLTFGFIRDVPLVPEYDKKALIEQALTEDLAYFEEFYDNLEEKQFTLIITQPLNTPQKGSDSQFGEENDAWVKWVATPLLCFYQVKQTMLDVNVQLLIPKEGVVDCAKLLP